MSLDSSSSRWSLLPVEIQLAITQHLDINSLLSLSLVSRYDHTLCLPALYNVRLLPATIPCSSMLIDDRARPSPSPCRP